MPSHIKTYDGSEDPEDHLKIFHAVAKTERWVMPTWCYIFNSTLTGNTRVWFDDLSSESIDSYDDLKKVFLENYLQQKKCIKDPIEIHNIKQREGESTEDFVKRYKLERRDVRGNYSISSEDSGTVQLTENGRSFIRHENNQEPNQSKNFKKGGQIQLLVKIGDEEHTASAWMNFVVVRSPSSYNGIIGKTKLVRWNRDSSPGPEGTTISYQANIEERVKEAINPGILRANNIFVWKPADRTGVPRHIVEHHLNMLEGCSPVRQKKRGQAADRNHAIQKEGRKLVEAEIMKEVHYHDWLSNPVIVKKHDDNAYKGYHQIQMAKEDQEKTEFITSQGIFCYTKMPFGLRNAGATYQRLVDKAFHKQIGKNLEVYVDDLVIKIRTEDEIVRDIEETFKTLREINMKLNPKKYKVDVVLSLPSPKCLKDVQKLNEKLASLNRFLAKSVEKSLPFFKTLKKCTKKSDFHWTTEAEEAFKQMKHLIAELPMLTAPMEKEELIVYLAAAKETILSRSEVAGRLQKWSIKLREYAIHYRPRVSVKGQILADFIVERPEEDSPDTLMEMEEELPEPWILFKNRSSYTDGSRAGLILINLEGMEFTYSLRFRFDATNNEAKYEALIAGLRIAEQMGVKNLQANVDSRLVANQVNGTPLPGKNQWPRRKSKSQLKRRNKIKVGCKKQEQDGRAPSSEFDMPTLRTAEVDMVQNNEALKVNLDLLEEKREEAAIREAKSKAKMEKYYNSKVRNTSFKPGDLVYLNNDASRAEDIGKLGPKWEGPYRLGTSAT
ncbi:reverse transcriptase domain-containing protein [Tanacetum coccineum]|uniref:Reverse transcriptase domain-containing protein n=1 Tax=Tanacetum coccineum TaxID=301880 RepID=A0ABQ5C3B3_9ASTR